MKKRLQLLLKTIVFLVVFAAVLFTVALITERKESYIKNKSFFDEAKKDHIDVLFLGSSHVINGINPLTIYDDYGFTSYNLGGHGSLLQESYWQLIRSLDYCKPEYVVVDCYMLEKNYKYLDVCAENSSEEDIKTSIEQLHLNMDAFPLSRLKIAAIDDLISDKDIKNQFLFNFIVYHDRWKELDSTDFKRLTGKADTNDLMGAEMRYAVKTDVDVYEPCEEGEVFSEHTVGEEYLMKIIDECQRDGIGILLTYIPFSAETKDQIASNTAEEVAARYGVPCLNMLEIDGIIDEATDLNDHGHLNVVGATKVSDYVGGWLAENTELVDHRGDEDYANWKKLVKSYKKQLKKITLEGGDLRTQLNLLTMSNMSYILYINNESDALRDEGVRHLISGMSGTGRIDEAAEVDGPYILINDQASGAKYEAVGTETLENVGTPLGELTYIPIEKKFRLLYPASDESINYLYDDTHLDEDIQILIYDNDSGEIIKHLYYSSQLMDYLLSY